MATIATSTKVPHASFFTACSLFTLIIRRRCKPYRHAGMGRPPVSLVIGGLHPPEAVLADGFDPLPLEGGTLHALPKSRVPSPRLIQWKGERRRANCVPLSPGGEGKG